MKLLLISDMESPALWDHYQPSRVEGVDLIVSCGDLKKEYLEFLVTLTGKPLFYIPGNHDTKYVRNPPEGCECIDGRVVSFQGIRFLGLGGCVRYSEGVYQYTEEEMRRRISKLRFQLWRSGGVDVLVTHAAAAGYGDASDRAHRGFQCYLNILDKYQPAWMFHGHIHQSYGWSIPRTVQYGKTTIINAFERYIIDI